MNLLGKLLFPNALPYEQRKKVQALMISVIVGVILSIVFVFLAFKTNNQHGGF